LPAVFEIFYLLSDTYSYLLSDTIPTIHINLLQNSERVNNFTYWRRGEERNRCWKNLCLINYIIHTMKDKIYLLFIISHTHGNTLHSFRLWLRRNYTRCRKSKRNQILHYAHWYTYFCRQVSVISIKPSGIANSYVGYTNRINYKEQRNALKLGVATATTPRYAQKHNNIPDIYFIYDARGDFFLYYRYIKSHDYWTYDQTPRML